ncbi:MAG: nucleoside kinase [Ruminococcus sp.]|jgi:uridine kinase|nr:nucleoside kinase [Ruminococcus sp.]
MKYIDIDLINIQVKENKNALIRQTENNYNSEIEHLARKAIVNRFAMPIMLISGPSGSGKTTTANLIKHNMSRLGYKATVVSLDNYFLPTSGENLPRRDDGELDLESPLRVDIPLFKEHLQKMEHGIPIQMPVFDFKTQRVSEYVPFKREQESVVIIEGIHTLNPMLTEEIREQALCVYVSVRTRVKSGDTLLHPSYIRLMRRLVRDFKNRGRTFEHTVQMFESVNDGEKMHILPYKKYADVDIDTFMEYEICVYGELLKRFRLREFGEFLEKAEDVRVEDVPSNSLVREFI